MSTVTEQDVVAFWQEAGAAAWYAQDEAFDQSIRDRFGATWQEAFDGTLTEWAVDAQGALGLIVLLDQFPRNMFRNDARAFATDAQAVEVAKSMLQEGWDFAIEGEMRQFVYLPFMHAEDLALQDHCIELMETRMEVGNNAIHARAHREIIARFGRFPYRNAALGRETTQAEQEMLDAGGYGAVLRALQAEG